MIKIIPLLKLFKLLLYESFPVFAQYKARLKLGVFLNKDITAEILQTIQARFDHQLPTETFNILCPHLVLLITSVFTAHFKNVLNILQLPRKPLNGEI
jgi:hypothetical protein